MEMLEKRTMYCLEEKLVLNLETIVPAWEEEKEGTKIIRREEREPTTESLRASKEGKEKFSFVSWKTFLCFSKIDFIKRGRVNKPTTQTNNGSFKK